MNETATVEAPGAHRTIGEIRRDGLWYCVKVFVAVRVALLIVGFLGVSLLPARAQVGVPGWADDAYTPGAHNLVTSFEQQDALWFLRIADEGYREGDGSAAFFPLYPVAVRSVSWAIGGHPLAAGLLVSNAAFLGALMMLYLLIRRERSDAVARRAVLYLAIFPTSFFFFAPYSESLFLLAAVTAFWAARLPRARWPVAGVAGVLAAATRSIGTALAPALAVEAIHRWRETPRERRRVGELVWALVWSASVIAGLLVYLWYWQRRTGDAMAPLRLQEIWQRETSFPLATLVSATQLAFRDGGYFLLDWLLVVPALGLAGIGLARLRPSYSVYTWLGILAPLSLVFAGRPLMSMPRFLLPLFPIFWVLAELSEAKKVPHTAIVALSAGGLGVLTVLFVNAYFIF